LTSFIFQFTLLTPACHPSSRVIKFTTIIAMSYLLSPWGEGRVRGKNVNYFWPTMKAAGYLLTIPDEIGCFDFSVKKFDHASCFMIYLK